jgi:hypothetical protein
MSPRPADVLRIIHDRAERYYGRETHLGCGKILSGDSRSATTFARLPEGVRFSWVITSPPYYGLRTYIPDQWIRNWFIGGPAHVDYSNEGQLAHASQDVFASQLKGVWSNLGKVCRPRARLVVRFGGINDRKADPLHILKLSLRDTGWRLSTVRDAGSASMGRRQASSFGHIKKTAIDEHDVWAVWEASPGE